MPKEIHKAIPSQRRAAVRLNGGRLPFLFAPTRSVFRQEVAQGAECFAREGLTTRLPVTSSNHGTIKSKTLTAVRVRWTHPADRAGERIKSIAPVLDV